MSNRDPKIASVIRFVQSKLSLAAVSTCALLILGGCTSIQPDFMDMTEAYERSIDMHQKKSLLTNMLRASNDLPLMFTDITTVAGTGSINTNSTIGASMVSAEPGSLAGFFSSTNGSSASIGTGLSTNRSFTFSLGSLNNEEFYRGFLTDTPLEDMYFYMRSDHPSKEFVASLLVDSIELTGQDGVKNIYVNDPLSPDYPLFQSVVYQLVDDGLTAEMINQMVDIGPALSKEDFNKVLPEISKLIQAKVQVRKLTTKPETYQLTMIVPKAKFCMDSALTQRRFGKQMSCKSLSQTAAAAQTVKNPGPAESSKETLLINLRSTKAVFAYLGKLIARQIGPNPVITTIRVPVGKGQFEQTPIILVHQGMLSPFDKLIASTNYQGTTYSVPLRDSGYSAKVFDLLSVMVTMNKIPGSIPASPGVLIR